MTNVNKVKRGWLDAMDGSDVNPKSKRYNTPSTPIGHPGNIIETTISKAPAPQTNHPTTLRS